MASTISGNLSVIAGGPITDGGTVAVTGSAAFETGPPPERPDHLDDNGDAIYTNTFGNLTLRTMDAGGTAAVATAIAVHENAAMALADVTSDGTVTLDAAGNITDTASPSITMAAGTLVLSSAVRSLGRQWGRDLHEHDRNDRLRGSGRALVHRRRRRRARRDGTGDRRNDGKQRRHKDYRRNADGERSDLRDGSRER
jgi:hypothetical protein